MIAFSGVKCRNMKSSRHPPPHWDLKLSGTHEASTQNHILDKCWSEFSLSLSFFFFFFKFTYLFIYHLSYTPYFICPIPIHPPTAPHPTPPPHPLSPRGCPNPPPHLTSKLPGASSLLRARCIISDWTQTQQSSAVYVLGALYQLVYAAWLVVQSLRDLRSPC